MGPHWQKVGPLAFALCLATGAAPIAQDQPTDLRDFRKIALTAGRSTVLATTYDITRIAVTDPDVADATVVEPREVLLDGKKAGTISLIVWGRSEREQYDLVVEPGITVLEQQLQTLFPGEDIKVNASEESVILSGRASSNQVMLRAGEIAQASAPKAAVINMLQLPGGMESQQVMLQVRMAEVNRRAVQELGATFISTRVKATGRVTTQQFAGPDFDDQAGSVGSLLFNDFLNIFFFNREEGFGAVIKALENSGQFQSLAEPNLIAYNGQEASFLAGGEFPVPVVQGATGTVTIEWKEFGVRLSFRPTIAGDVIRLKVRPEVSTLDFANGITLAGFRIPSLTTRRAETEVELRDGQSFAIAGLLDNVAQNDRAAIPILSKVPIIGNLFKSKAERSERTELMVLITPRLVRPLDPDEVPTLPTVPERFLPPREPGPNGGEGTAMDAPTLDVERSKGQAPAPRR